MADLEYELQTQLHFPRVSEADNTSVRVRQRARGPDVGIDSVSQRRVERGRVCVIEQVVRIRPQLGKNIFPDVKLLGERVIEIPKSGIAQHHSGGRAIARRENGNKSFGVEELRLSAVAAAEVRVGDPVRPVKTGEGIGESCPHATNAIFLGSDMRLDQIIRP